jgi:hypothetical protein
MSVNIKRIIHSPYYIVYSYSSFEVLFSLKFLCLETGCIGGEEEWNGGYGM